jgi:hypothetical protein
VSPLKDLVEGLANSVINWGQKQAEKPETTKDANTPEIIKRRWRDYVTGFLRDKKRGGD